jgi:hypothetical protein
MSATKAVAKMSDEMRNQLVHLQRDYTAFEGKPFEHFFCPMLLKDENVELCMGHIVNDKIPNSSGVRIVQRKDVDGFYGRAFESDFVTLLEARAAKPKDAVFNACLSKKMKPRIVVDGKDCPYYLDRGTTLPPDHTGIHLEHPDGDAIKLVLKKKPDEFKSERTRGWQIVVERDCRVTALVSLIKAGYLTLFRMLGYRYALSGPGIEVGHNILGKFFRLHGGESVDDARAEARRWFRPFVNMMRPIDRFSGTAPRGTIEDNVAMACFGEYSENAFGLIVCVRTNTTYEAVLMPVYNDANSAAAYHKFLTGKDETLRVSYCEFHPKEQCWHRSEEIIETTWPKGHSTFEFDD